MKYLETEFKWDANTPRAFARMRAAWRRVKGVRFSQAVRLSIWDVYMDAPDGNFAREQIAFRVRCTGGKWEATFKTRSEVKNGKAVRREETLPMPGVTTLEGALRFLNAKKSWKGLRVQGLKPLFEIRNRRQAAAEMAFDAFEIRVCGRRVQMKEIELEHKQGCEKNTERLARELTDASGLGYAAVSKVKTATELLKLWGNK